MQERPKACHNKAIVASPLLFQPSMLLSACVLFFALLSFYSAKILKFTDAIIVNMCLIKQPVLSICLPEE